MYPASARERDAWIVAARGPKAPLVPSRAYAAVWEEERSAAGALVPTAVVFLTNAECPFRCVMCDLWQHTLDTPVGRGDVPAQIRAALATLPPARAIKLYNAGSFFDPHAIPPSDDEAIAHAVDGFDHVIVEAHPAFLSGPHRERCLALRDRLTGTLEVAIGLETAHEPTLALLNKRMSLGSFRRAADFLNGHGISLRVFILLNPPFLSAADGEEWACRSIDVAIACGASVCSIIATRGGNGAMEQLGDRVSTATLPALERVIEYGLARKACRVFADLWDIERLFTCACAAARAERLRVMNRDQRVPAPVTCAAGGGSCDTGR